MEEQKIINERRREAEKQARKERRAKRKKERQGFFAEFKKFITRGNVVDMAIGVAVATAFTAIVTSVTKGLISPILAYISRDSSMDGLKTVLRPELKVIEEGVEVIKEAEIAINWGMILQAMLDFIIIAFTLFLVMKIAGAIIKRTNKVMQGIKELADEEAAAEKAEAEAKAKKEAEEKAAAEKAAAEAAAAKAAEEKAKQEKLYSDISEQNELLRKIAASLEKK